MSAVPVQVEKSENEVSLVSILRLAMPLKKRRLLPGQTILTGSLASGPPLPPVGSRPTTVLVASGLVASQNRCSHNAKAWLRGASLQTPS